MFTEKGNRRNNNRIDPLTNFEPIKIKMKNSLKTVVVPLTFLVLLLVTACSDDDCSGIANSIPPHETIVLQFIDQEGKEVLLDTKLVSFTATDPNEKIAYLGTSSFSGFLVGHTKPVRSNQLDITYKKEDILTLNYTKEKRSSSCHGDHYFIQDIAIKSLSENYKIESQSEGTMHFAFVIRVME